METRSGKGSAAVGSIVISLAALLCMVVTNHDAHANATEPQVLATPPTDGSRLTTGDEVQVRIYQVAGSNDGVDHPQPLSSLIEHSELTGKYVVDLDGTIIVPLVGTVSAAGQTEIELQHALERKASDVFKGRVKATVQIVRREPIYVTGSVSHPGVFNYTPGMTVLHAITLAGTRTSGIGMSESLQALQDLEQLRRSNARLASLLARRDVLVADRDGKQPTPSQTLVELVGASLAAQEMARAEKLAKLETDRNTSAQKGLDDNVSALENRRTILLESLKDAQAALENNATRFNLVSQRHKSGIVTDDNYNRAAGDLDATRARWNELRAAIAGLEERLVEVRGQQAKVIADIEIDREREISTLQASIAEAMATQSTLQPALANIGLSDVVGASVAEYAIIRRSRSGLEKMQANPFSFLKPGDIVTVMRQTPSARPLGTVGIK